MRIALDALPLVSSRMTGIGCCIRKSSMSYSFLTKAMG